MVSSARWPFNAIRDCWASAFHGCDPHRRCGHAQDYAISREVEDSLPPIVELLQGVDASYPARGGVDKGQLQCLFAHRSIMQCARNEPRQPASAFYGDDRPLPLQNQKQLRLQEAWQLLLSGDRNSSDVAFAVGYESASQFSREYRRQFGATPARSVRQIRRAIGVRRLSERADPCLWYLDRLCYRDGKWHHGTATADVKYVVARNPLRTNAPRLY